MPRPRTKAEDIRNPEHYFNKYIAMEIKHDKVKQIEIEDNECSLDEKMEFNSFEYNIAINKNGESYEEIFAENSDFVWIERIKNPKLYQAIQTLSDEQKEILTAIFEDEMSQDELATRFGISQQAISKRVKKIFQEIKNFFQ